MTMGRSPAMRPVWRTGSARPWRPGDCPVNSGARYDPPAGDAARVGTKWLANVTFGAAQRPTSNVTFAGQSVPTRAPICTDSRAGLYRLAGLGGPARRGGG